MKVKADSFWKFIVACLRTGNENLAKNIIKQNKKYKNNMKARIKKTGEIVTLRDLYNDGTARDINGRYYHQGDILEFIEESNRSVDWEQRRYEIAKDVLTASFSTPMEGTSILSYVRSCVQVADILIEELKGGKQ